MSNDAGALELRIALLQRLRALLEGVRQYMDRVLTDLETARENQHTIARDSAAALAALKRVPKQLEPEVKQEPVE